MFGYGELKQFVAPRRRFAAALRCGHWSGVLLLVGAMGCTQKSDDPGGLAAGAAGTTEMTAPVNSGAGAGAGMVATTAGSTAQPQPGAAGSTTGPDSAGAAGSAPTQADPSTDAGLLTDASAAPTDAGEVPEVHEDLGVGDGSDVVTIGDSWMNYLLSGGGIEGALSRAGKQYRGYGVAGTTLLSGQIPGQYTRAKAAGEIQTVIMTGGGNDIMFSGGCATPEACKASLQALSDGLNDLWTTMSADGVKDVVYIRYSRGAGTTDSDNLPTEPPDPPAICISGPIRCTSMDTTDFVMDSLLDGIHPTPSANDRIVMGLLELLEMKGIRR